MFLTAKQIPEPSYAGRAVTVIILLTVAVNGLGIVPLLLRSWSALHILMGCALTLLALSLVFHNSRAIHLTLFTLLSLSWARFHLWPESWPFHPLVPLGLYGILVVSIPSLRATFDWLHLGVLDRFILGWVILTGLLSGLALVLWFVWYEPDLTRYLHALPATPLFLLLPIGLGFSLVNALLEEAIYRGLIMQAVEAALGVGLLAILVQALLFGLVHIGGIPKGWTGVGMATLYGLMLGGIRRRAQGLLAPFIAHVFADIVIFSLLILGVKGHL